MSYSPLILKNPKGWFAAGSEVLRAMMALSDGAFKLFMYLCLHARRDTGVMHTTQTELARGLKKSHGTIRKHLREMEKAGICQIRFGHDPRGQGLVQIADLYWPYRQGGLPPATDASDAYVVEIRKMLDERACIRPSFSTADEMLAREWFSRGVPLERIEQAILMGCGRKYVSWRNNQSHAPISSLRYFEAILAEIQQQKIPEEYWGYVRFRIERMEQLWIESFGRKSRTGASEDRPYFGATDVAANKRADSGAQPELSQCLTNLPD